MVAGRGLLEYWIVPPDFMNLLIFSTLFDLKRYFYEYYYEVAWYTKSQKHKYLHVYYIMLFKTVKRGAT